MAVSPLMQSFNQFPKVPFLPAPNKLTRYALIPGKLLKVNLTYPFLSLNSHIVSSAWRLTTKFQKAAAYELNFHLE